MAEDIREEDRAGDRETRRTIGLFFVQIAFPLLQSKSMIDHALVPSGSVYPLLLQGMIIVLRFICHRGGASGSRCTAESGSKPTLSPLLRGPEGPRNASASVVDAAAIATPSKSSWCVVTMGSFPRVVGKWGTLPANALASARCFFF